MPSIVFEVAGLTEFVYDKPVLTIFRERTTNPETAPFVVIKARKLIVNKNGNEINGSIQDFFRLMGDVDYFTSTEGVTDNYVLCWFDDTVPEINDAHRRLQGVVFKSKVTCEINERGKRTYNATFTAKHGKLE